MKIYQLLICFILIMSCNKEEIIVDNFSLNFESKGTISFDNSECEFNNRNNQYQGSTSFESSVYRLGANYFSTNDLDSINTFFIELIVDYEAGNESLRSEYIKGILDSEDSSENMNKLHPRIEVQVCGKSYNNGSAIVTSKFNENFKYKINDFEVLYNSECLEKDLLYLDITIEGLLKESFPFATDPDSLYLNESNMKLLFDLNIQ